MVKRSIKNSNKPTKAKVEKKVETEEVDEGLELCPKCGSQMVWEDGRKICPDCDTEIDFFGDKEEA